jgi:hypothetical protein
MTWHSALVTAGAALLPTPMQPAHVVTCVWRGPTGHPLHRTMFAAEAARVRRKLCDYRLAAGAPPFGLGWRRRGRRWWCTHAVVCPLLGALEMHCSKTCAAGPYKVATLDTIQAHATVVLFRKKLGLHPLTQRGVCGKVRHFYHHIC